MSSTGPGGRKPIADHLGAHPATLARALAIFAAAVAPSAASQAASAASAAEQSVVAQEKDSWRAWKDKDIAFWQRHLSADHVEMDGPGGPGDKNSVLRAIPAMKCSVTSYDLGDFTFRQFDRNTALVVYKATQQWDCLDAPQTGWITSLYERRHGRWENVLFEHLPVRQPPPAKP